MKTLNFLEKSRRVDLCKTVVPDYLDKLKCIITGDFFKINLFFTICPEKDNKLTFKLKNIYIYFILKLIIKW